MYLFVYKTTHVNGKFYIGRHQTENLNDGYLGSGRWVANVKNKSSLSREIIAKAKSFEELCELEEYYIDLHWDDPLCMNMKKASIGWSSEDFQRFCTDRTNPFQTRPDGTSVSSDRVKLGTNPFQTRPDGTSLQQDKVKNGTHHFLTRSDGTNVNTDRIKSGTHNFLTRSDGSNLQTDRVKLGTNPFQTRPDGTSLQQDKVKNGTHHLLKNKNYVHCYNKQGEYVKISKQQFNSQSGPKEDWEWVGIKGNEGKRRKLLKKN